MSNDGFDEPGLLARAIARPITTEESNLLSKAELNTGWRLAVAKSAHCGTGTTKYWMPWAGIELV